MRNIVVTGAAGFIGSNLVRRLNKEGFPNLILVDHFGIPAKQKNLDGVDYELKIERNEFINWFSENSQQVNFIFHLGARTDTGEFNFEILDSLNLNYSKALWKICVAKQIPLLYASSAATYGSGEGALLPGSKGFSDDHDLLKNLKPLNPYGMSKHLFDIFAIEQAEVPPFWGGLKFFNVFGPHENHKGRMASVIFHAYYQILETGTIKLFKSHRPDFRDGEQLRDFIYVDDVIDVCMFFFDRHTAGINDGIYNVGTGIARTFNDLSTAIFSNLLQNAKIEYIPTPLNLRDKYQYRTEAKMEKLINAGYGKKFTSLEEAIAKYIGFLKSL